MTTTSKILAASSVALVLSGVLFISQGVNKPKQVQVPSTPVAVVVEAKQAAVPQESAFIPGFEKAQVIKVIDGDTIEVNLNSKVENVRFIGMDTPETVDPRKPVGCFGKEASDATKSLLTGKTVLLEKDVEDRDIYKRILRYIYLDLGNGQTLFVNDYLVREGFAKTLNIPPDSKYADRFLQAQIEARSGNKGLWASCQKS
jgi:endonuclease YncB( thermonuclease family)